jgi:hypothetical protein
VSVVKATNGQLTVTPGGTLVLQAGSQIDVDLTSASGISDGDTFVVGRGTGAGTTVVDNGTAAVTDNSFLFDFTHTIVSNNSLVLTVIQNTTATVCDFPDPNLAALCGQVVTLGGNPDADVIANLLGSATTEQEFNALITGLGLSTSFGSATLGFDFSNMFSNSVADWLNNNGGANPASLNLYDDAMTSLNDPNADWQRWGSSSFSFGFQDAFTANGGYRINDFDSNSTTHVLGLDRFIDDGNWSQGPARIGLATSYGYGWGEEYIANNGPMQIGQHSIGILAYGEANYEGYKVSGNLGYTYHWNEQRRYVGSVGDMPKADYESYQFFGQATVEPNSPYRFGDWEFSPKLSYDYRNLYREGYSETGFVAAMIVGSASIERHEVKTRFTVGRDWTDKSRGEAFVEYGQNFGDNPETSVAFNAGGSAFKVQGVNADDEWFTLGSSFAVDFKKNAVFGLSHQSTLGENSHSHDINTWFRVKF